MVLTGDYSKFPYERAKGPVREDDPNQMLLWDPEPDEDELRLVAFCGGRIEEWAEARFQRLLGALTPR